MTMNLKASFVSFLKQKFPGLSSENIDDHVSENLLSPFQIPLSLNQIEIIKQEIASYRKLRKLTAETSKQDYLQLDLQIPNNESVCMSYDFHINAEGRPELIEINTNAAFLGLGLQLYEFLNLPNIADNKFNGDALLKMFLNELKLVAAPENSVAIIDENPSQQRLYLEFLVFREILRGGGIKSDIFDVKDVSSFENYGLIYNRYTDFYLQSPASAPLKKLFNDKKNLSPHPWDYFLSADKRRLLDWNEQSQIAKPSSLLNTYDLGKYDREEIWKIRKNLFIKPKTSYGSKQVYKAGNMSRRMFDEIYGDGFIAQQLSSPSEIKVELQGVAQSFKYDLRCYTYEDDLQLIIARLYQGQTTNLKTIGGGFAAIIAN